MYSNTRIDDGYKDRAAYLRFIKTVPADRRHFFEQAVRNVKGFFDLDGGTREQHQEVVEHLIKFYNDVLERELSTDEIAILDGSRDGKVSTHLIINDGAYFKTMADMKIVSTPASAPTWPSSRRGWRGSSTRSGRLAATSARRAV
eukprot:SAG25_NODE_59_length_18387_cov_33.379770_5_plen_145_part_00